MKSWVCILLNILWSLLITQCFRCYCPTGTITRSALYWNNTFRRLLNSVYCNTNVWRLATILVTEHWARSWSRCTGSQSTVDILSHSGGRLPLLSARPAVTFPAEERHRPSTSTKLYCLVTEAHRCEQLTHCCYAALPPIRIEPMI